MTKEHEKHGGKYTVADFEVKNVVCKLNLLHFYESNFIGPLGRIEHLSDKSVC